MCVLVPTLIVIVAVPEPGAGIVDGLKVTLVPEGTPDADRAIAPLKPPLIVAVIVELRCVPSMIVSDDGDAEIENVGEPVTVSVNIVVC